MTEQSQEATMGVEWNEQVLSYDIFAGDFGDGSARTLRDEIVVAKRRGTCRECDGPIVKGDIVRAVKMADSEGVYGGRVCFLCCDAMAKSVHDGGKAITERYSMRHV